MIDRLSILSLIPDRQTARAEQEARHARSSWRPSNCCLQNVENSYSCHLQFLILSFWTKKNVQTAPKSDDAKPNCNARGRRFRTAECVSDVAGHHCGAAEHVSDVAMPSMSRRGARLRRCGTPSQRCRHHLGAAEHVSDAADSVSAMLNTSPTAFRRSGHHVGAAEHVCDAADTISALRTAFWRY